ncbi:MAG: hypothetical protein GPJ54_15435 [Candidatus Heimdallarchaeota archaeon]|nr:hypothetical protein [Candidatus Heimdallarchaeota archaeon]
MVKTLRDMVGDVVELVELVRNFRIWLHKVDPVFVNELVEQTTFSTSPPSQTSVDKLYNKEVNQNRDAELKNYLDYMKLINMTKKKENGDHIPVDLDKMEQQLIDRVEITNNSSRILEYTDNFVDELYRPIVESNPDSDLANTTTAYEDGFIALLEASRNKLMDTEKWCLLISMVTHSLKTVLYHDLGHLVEENDDPTLKTLLELSRTERIIKAQTRGQIEDFIDLRLSIVQESNNFDKKVLNTMISLLTVIGIDKL